MPDFQASPVKVFIVYARENKDFKERIELALRPAVRRGEIELFTDAQIEFGEDWRARLATELARARIAVFLLSLDYYASDFIHQDEAVVARERHERGELLILPVVVEKCLWKRDPFLSKIQLLPSDGEPIGDLKNAAAFAEVAEAIESKALEIQQKEVEKHQKELKKAETEARKLETERLKLESEIQNPEVKPAFVATERTKPEPKNATKKSEIRNPKPAIEPPILAEKKGLGFQVAGIVAGVLLVAALAFWGLKKAGSALLEKAMPVQKGVVFLPKPDSAIKNSNVPIVRLPPGTRIGMTVEPTEKTSTETKKAEPTDPKTSPFDMPLAKAEIENGLLPLAAGEIRIEPNGDRMSFSDAFIGKHEITALQFWALTGEGKNRTRASLTRGDKMKFEKALRAATGKLFHVAGPYEIQFAEAALGRKLVSDGLGFRVFILKSELKKGD